MHPEGSVPSTTRFVLLTAIGGLVPLFDWALDHRELLLVPRPAAPPTNAPAVVGGAESRTAAADEAGDVPDPDARDAADAEARDAPDGDGASVADVSMTDEIDALRLLLAEAAVLGAPPTRPGERAAWRPKELSILDGLSGAIRFVEDGATPEPRTREVLARIADLLAPVSGATGFRRANEGREGRQLI